MDHTRSPSQRSAVIAAMLAAGALIAQQVAGKATRDALFLSSFQVSSLPLVMIASALASGLAVVAFSAALSRRSPARVVPAALGVGSVLLIAEWGLSLALPRLAAVAVYLHMAVFGATVTSGFWSLVNERFDPYTAKRVMGRIGLGASMGGVSGGLLAWSAAGTLPVPAMLLGMAAFNVVCLFALARLGAPAREGQVPDVGPSDAPARLSGLHLLRELPYLRQLAMIVFLGAATETMLDYILNAQAAATFSRGEPLMSFFALFHTGVGLLALIVGLMFSRSALRGLGLAGTVALRPAAVAVAALLGAVDSRLWTALLARGAHGVLHNSLFRAGYELLYTPLPERLKRPTKTIVDVGFDRLGTLLSGSLILVLVSALPGPSARVLFALAAVGGLAALVISRRLHTGYISALEESLRSGAVRLEAGDVVDSTTLLTLAHAGSTLERQVLREAAPSSRERPEQDAQAARSDAVAETVAVLRSGQPETLRKALRRMDDLDPAMVGHVIPLLASNEVFLDALRALRRVAVRATGQLLDVLLDPHQDVVLRARVARVLRGSPTQRAADGLLQALADPRFAVRRQCALTLARIVERDPSLRVPRDEVFAATVRELGAGTHAWDDSETATVEESTRENAESPGSPSERGLSHVFTLLSLSLEREHLRIAHWAVLGEDQVLRGTALEYLENVLPDSVRAALWPHLGVRSRPSRAARPRQQVVEELMRWGGSLSFGRNLLKKRSD